MSDVTPPPSLGGGALNVPGFPYAVQKPFNNITPFTYRDGLTFAELMEDFRNWIINSLIGFVDSRGDDIITEYNKASALVGLAIEKLGEDRSAFETLSVDIRTAIFAARDATEEYADDAKTASDLARDYAGAFPPGYDIVILAGQSNMSGRGTDFSLITDPVDPNVFQYMSKGVTANTIQPAVEPLNMHDTPSGIGPGLQFARWYAARRLRPNRKVLLVPVAHGGTPLSSTAVLGWRKGVANNLYANMITQTLGALALGNANGYQSKVVAALWIQGETDGDGFVPGATYQADLDALINGLRVDVGVSDLPFIIGTMVPEYLSTGTRSAIDAVQRDTPNRIPRVGVALSAMNANNGDGNHFNAPGQRFNGLALFNEFDRIATAAIVSPTIRSANVPGINSLTLGFGNGLQAYSLRKVNSTYGGSAITVRRSTDNTTIDVKFNSVGDLDTDTLSAFVGTGNGYVTKWWDQSGYGRHVEQTVLTAQPLIVSAGATVTSGGRPAVKFDGVDDVLFNTTPVLYASGSATVAVVINAATPASQLRTWSESSSTSTSAQYGLMQPDGATISGGLPVVRGLSGNPTFSGVGLLPFYNNAIHTGISYDTGSHIAQFVDGVADTMDRDYGRPASLPGVDRFALGGLIRNGSLAPHAMLLSEFVAWGTALASPARTSITMNHKTAYGIA